MSDLAERLAHIKGVLLKWKATCDAATPGPYTHEIRQSIGCMVDTIRAREADGADWEVGEMRSYPGDAEFVILARTALPSTIAYLLEDCERAASLLRMTEGLPPMLSEVTENLAEAEALIARLEGVTGRGAH